MQASIQARNELYEVVPKYAGRVFIYSDVGSDVYGLVLDHGPAFVFP